LKAIEKEMLASPDQQVSLTDPDSRSMATSGRGSSRAPLHKWTINVVKGTASCEQGRYRQLTPASKRLDIKPIVAGICGAVQEGPESNSPLVQRKIIVWKGIDEVSIRHGDLISGNSQQTIASRRKRFRGELTDRMKALGWDFVGVSRTMIFKRSRA
jgi:hypothetical protein